MACLEDIWKYDSIMAFLNSTWIVGGHCTSLSFTKDDIIPSRLWIAYWPVPWCMADCTCGLRAMRLWEAADKHLDRWLP